MAAEPMPVSATRSPDAEGPQENPSLTPIVHRPLREKARLAPRWMKWSFLVYYLALLGGIGAAAHRVAVWRSSGGWELTLNERHELVSQRASAQGKTATAPPAAEGADYDPIVYLVVFAGMLGGALHGLASLEYHAGRGQFYDSWWVFYVARPFVGGAMAVVIYLLLRSGVLGVNVSPGSAAYVLVGWAAMAGLFSSPALRKLRDTFEVLFHSATAQKEDAPKTGLRAPLRETPAPVTLKPGTAQTPPIVPGSVPSSAPGSAPGSGPGGGPNSGPGAALEPEAGQPDRVTSHGDTRRSTSSR